MGDELLRLWRETSATVLLITHALDEANLLSDRIGVYVGATWPLPRYRRDRLATRPRSAPGRACRFLGAVTSRLWSYLRGESLRAMGQGTATQ